MASRQDQLHSYQFTVQRVVSALVVGDTDPARSPFRKVGGAVMAGVLLGALTLAAAAVYGVLAPGGGTGWRDGGSVIVERESGARYVYLGGQLHPVPNYTSALLVIGSAQARTVTVARSALAGTARGAALGIAAAPDPLPAADRLLPAPWALCSARFGDGPVQSILYVGRVPGGGTDLGDATGFLVSTPDGTDYLVWRHNRYRVAGVALAALAWGAENPTPVAPALVNSLAAGPDLTAPTVSGQRGTPSQVPHVQVGQVVAETVPGGGKQYAVALADRLAGVSELQAALLLAQSGVGEFDMAPNDFTRYLTGTPLTPTGGAALPERRPELSHPHTPDRGTCAVVGAAREVVSYDVPVAADGVRVAAPPATGGAPVTADRVAVAPGRGAVVSAAGALSVVSELGIRYPVPSQDVLGMLGYGGVSPVSLPPAVVSLLPVGPALDPTTARTPAAS